MHTFIRLAIFVLFMTIRKKIHGASKNRVERRKNDERAEYWLSIGSIIGYILEIIVIISWLRAVFAIRCIFCERLSVMDFQLKFTQRLIPAAKNLLFANYQLGYFSGMKIVVMMLMMMCVCLIFVVAISINQKLKLPKWIVRLKYLPLFMIYWWWE